MTIEWWLLIIIGIVGLIVQGRLQSVFSKYSKVPMTGGLTGREVAEKMLRDNGIAAAAVAAHETGHAIQDAYGYAPLRVRSALVPVISFASQWSFLLIIVGIILINTMPAIFWAGIALIALSAIFSVITLPVEYNASNRAMQWLEASGTLHGEALQQAGTALRWAARTYLVAALSAIATLLYYIGFARRD